MVALILLPITWADIPEIAVALANTSFAGAEGGAKLRFKVTVPVVPFFPSAAIQYSVVAAAVKFNALVMPPVSSFDATTVSELTLLPV